MWLERSLNYSKAQGWPNKEPWEPLGRGSALASMFWQQLDLQRSHLTYTLLSLSEKPSAKAV